MTIFLVGILFDDEADFVFIRDIPSQYTPLLAKLVHLLLLRYRSTIGGLYMEELSRYKNNQTKKIIVGALLATVCIVVALVYHVFFAAPALRASRSRFVISMNATTSNLGAQLKSAGYIRNVSVFDHVFGTKQLQVGITPGTYEIARSMNVWQIVSVLKNPPSEVWVVIPPGLRKEEIITILADKLGWTDAQKAEWVRATTTDAAPDYFEGVYFPDTYLIPRTDSPTTIAKRFIAQFETQFAPYAKEAAAQNIQWTTVLKVASLIQREAGSSVDMPIISGVIWNRLAQKMKLQIDATVQYARGDTGAGWWAPVSVADLKIDSPYNTYLYAGLPPHPIANPGLDAINAAINPATTTCLYYIHDSSRNIHCATTNAEQNANIAKYLQ